MLESNGSIAFATVYEGPKGAKEQILSPEPVLTSNYYTSSKLAPQIEALKAKRNWSHYLFVFQPTPEREEWRRLLKETYPEGRETIVTYSEVFNQKTLLFEVENRATTQNPSPDVLRDPDPNTSDRLSRLKSLSDSNLAATLF
jgi:hypothetical protein